MSVLIRGMEMPFECADCDFCGGLILPDGIYCCECPTEASHGKNISDAIDADTRPDWCPLIEVKAPHGRLIDADEFKETIDYYIKEAGWSDVHNESLEWTKEFIDNEQTIIEAERSEDMSKYVIELEDAPYRKANGMSEPLYRVKGFNSLVFDQNGLDKLEKFDIDYVKSHLDLGVLQESTYKKGLAEAWSFAGHLANITDDITNIVYWSMNGGKGLLVAFEMTYEEARKEYDEYFAKKKDEVKIGDEVVSLNGDGEPIEGLLPWVVTRAIADWYYGIGADGSAHSSNKKRVRKTGRHFDTMNKLLEEMKA